MRIVFMGTPDFAVPSLDILIKEGYEIAAVVTQPDKPKGRGRKVTPPPVKGYALRHGLCVLQPAKIKTQEFVDQLKNIKPDLIITVAYGKILSKEILDIPKRGCINVHGSLLPKYRGAAPLHWAIINGETVTGITTMLMDTGMDTGDMLLKKEVEITDKMTVGQLHDKMMVVGAQVLLETLKKYQQGNLERVTQANRETTSAPIMNKETGRIDWGEPAFKIHNLVRGTNPWPGAFTFYKGEKVKVWQIEVVKTLCDERYEGTKTGTVCKVDKDGILVAAGEGMVRILEVQFNSCRKMHVSKYICGHTIDKGEIFG